MGKNSNQKHDNFFSEIGKHLNLNSYFSKDE